MRRQKLPRILLAALKETGLPWAISKGGRHIKIFVDGRLAGILPFGQGCPEADMRPIKNTIRNIRQIAAGLSPSRYSPESRPSADGAKFS